MTPQFQDIVEEFDDIFEEALPGELPPERELDFEINPKRGEPPPRKAYITTVYERVKRTQETVKYFFGEGTHTSIFFAVRCPCIFR